MCFIIYVHKSPLRGIPKNLISMNISSPQKINVAKLKHPHLERALGKEHNIKGNET